MSHNPEDDDNSGIKRCMFCGSGNLTIWGSVVRCDDCNENMLLSETLEAGQRYNDIETQNAI